MSSMDTLREELWNNDWTFIVPNFQEKYLINTFDDGNHDIPEKYHNEWIIFGKWKEKVALFNYHQPEFVIRSISHWKILKI